MIKQNNNSIDSIKKKISDNKKDINKFERGFSKFYDKYKSDTKDIKSTLRSMNRIVSALYDKSKGKEMKSSMSRSATVAQITASPKFSQKIDSLEKKVKTLGGDVFTIKNNSLPGIATSIKNTNKELAKISKNMDKAILSREMAPKEKQQTKLERIMEDVNSPISQMREEMNDNFEQLFDALNSSGGGIGSVAGGSLGSVIGKFFGRKGAAAAAGGVAGEVALGAGAGAAAGGIFSKIGRGAKAAGMAAAAGATKIATATDPFFRAKWKRFLLFLARKAPKALGQQALRRLALAGGLATFPLAGWIGSLLTIGLSLPMIYQLYSWWEAFNELPEEEQALYDNEEKAKSTEIDLIQLDEARKKTERHMQVSEKAQAEIVAERKRKNHAPKKPEVYQPVAPNDPGLIAQQPTSFGSTGNLVYDALLTGKGAIDNPVGMLQANANVKNVIETAAKAVGVDPSLMLAIARQESMFDSNAQAGGNSTAKGLFQFTDETFADMVSKYSKQFPVLLKGPYDPQANAIAAALYIRQNAKTLEDNGIAVNPTSIYAAHFLGAGGAQILFGTDPATPAYMVLPKAATNNPSIFYKGKEKTPRTIAEVRDILYNKVGKVAEQYAANGNMVPELEGSKADPRIESVAMKQESGGSESIIPSIPTPVGMILSADNTSNKGPYAPPVQPGAGGVQGPPDRANRGLISTLAGGIAGHLVSQKLASKMGPEGALLGEVAGDLVSSGLGKLFTKPTATGEVVDSGTRDMERERQEAILQSSGGNMKVIAPTISTQPGAPQAPAQNKLADAAVRTAESAFMRALAKDFSHPSAFTTVNMM